jgi:NAD+-dependent secondary alcohol dehydrogenase Adh1
MKAAVLHAFDEKLTAKEFVKYEDVTDPKISRPMDVIVRIGGAGVCRTDLHIVEGIWRSKVDVKLPYIMGHENAGWVEAIGPGVEAVTRNTCSRASALSSSYPSRWRRRMSRHTPTPG